MGDKNTIKVGSVPYSSNIWDEKGRSELVQVFISGGHQINSLQFQYFESGALVLSNRYGQLTGDTFHVVKLDYPSEYLTSIGGSRSNSVLKSIIFHTNLRKHGPFGHPASGFDRKEFCYELGEDRQFGGFHGTGDSYIGSIGVYIKPITTLKANALPVKVEAK